MLLDTVFYNLFENEKYFNTVYPHLDEKLFTDHTHRILFRSLKSYSEKYNTHPKAKDVKLVLSVDNEITEEETDECMEFLSDLKQSDMTENTEFLIDETERWVKDRHMEMAILDSVEVLKKNQPRGIIEQRIKEALAISFKNDLGIHYLEDAVKQYEFYTSDEIGIPVDVPSINEAVGGGFRKKAVYIFLGRTNIGKTLWLNHLAASFKKSGYNGVYFTAEMSENAIGKRIDANILDMEMNSLGKNLDKNTYFSKVKKVLDTHRKGSWFIKEYPPGYASKNNMVAYLQELKLKKNVVPDIIIVDYVNIFASARLPMSMKSDSYQYMKAVIEELRAIGVEHEVPVITATQTNRESANKNSDSMDMTGVSESWGMPQTADWMGAIIQPPELFEEGKYLLKILKTRFGENIHDVKTIGVDRSHMRLLELPENEQDIPIVVRDRLKRADIKRETLEKEEDDRIFVFDEELK